MLEIFAMLFLHLLLMFLFLCFNLLFFLLSRHGERPHLERKKQSEREGRQTAMREAGGQLLAAALEVPAPGGSLSGGAGAPCGDGGGPARAAPEVLRRAAPRREGPRSGG